MRLIATSDFHGQLDPAVLPPGDVLVLAGDLLADAPEDARDPVGWQAERLGELDALLADLPYREVLLVAGNHDGVLQARPELGRALRGARYLQDEACGVAGVRFFGSPWQPHLCKHPFFMPDGREAWALYRRIPADTDVVITHAPPWGILDAWEQVEREEGGIAGHGWSIVHADEASRAVRHAVVRVGARLGDHHERSRARRLARSVRCRRQAPESGQTGPRRGYRRRPRRR